MRAKEDGIAHPGVDILLASLTGQNLRLDETVIHNCCSAMACLLIGHHSQRIHCMDYCFYLDTLKSAVDCWCPIIKKEKEKKHNSTFVQITLLLQIVASKEKLTLLTMSIHVVLLVLARSYRVD